MKHEKKWITCDRCGCEIKNDLKRLLHSVCIMPTKCVSLDTITIDGIDPYVKKEVQEIESENKFLEMEISYSYKGKTREFHLCPRCRKDFDRFMKGEI